jgi:paired amphipathic helix protein Sin3a
MNYIIQYSTMGGTRNCTLFEEALHKSEEERSEYQVHMEGLIKVIALLELLCTHFEDMMSEERTLFKLKLILAGPA